MLRSLAGLSRTWNNRRAWRWGNHMSEWRFKLLYDGACPFCRIEARWLRRLDRQNRLVIEDIAATGFDPAGYGVPLVDLMGSLHGAFPDGRMTRGMETFRQAYRAIGLGWLLAPTGWPGLRWLFDFAYAVFARYRVRAGRLFGRSCGDRCAVPRAKG